MFFFASNALAMQRIREATSPKVKKTEKLERYESFNQTTFTKAGKPIFICNQCGERTIGAPPTCEHYRPV